MCSLRLSILPCQLVELNLKRTDALSYQTNMRQSVSIPSCKHLTVCLIHHPKPLDHGGQQTGWIGLWDVHIKICHRHNKHAISESMNPRCGCTPPPSTLTHSCATQRLVMCAHLYLKDNHECVAPKALLLELKSLLTLAFQVGKLLFMQAGFTASRLGGNWGRNGGSCSSFPRFSHSFMLCTDAPSIPALLSKRHVSTPPWVKTWKDLNFILADKHRAVHSLTWLITEEK